MSPGLESLPKSAHDRLRRQPQPRWVDPTLATLVHEPFSDPDWLFEPKLDGQRCLVFKQGQDVWLLSRNRKRLDETYPELLRAFAEQPCRNGVFDSEIVAFENGRSSFARLQGRMQLGSADRNRMRETPIRCYVFDLLHIDGYDVTALALRDRKKLLKRALRSRDPIRLLQHRNSDGVDYYREACRAGWEGALAKDATRGYARGRSRTWLKFKCVHEQEFVIGGFTDPAGSRTGLGALLVGYYDGGRLVYGGKVGTGFTEETLQDLRDRLGSRERTRSPFSADPGERGAHWTAPELVAEIAFTEWTEDGKLRHPRYLGLRRDKNPADVVAERPT